MRLGVISEDVRLCHQLATMSYDNKFKIFFINESDDDLERLDCIVVDLDGNQSLKECEDYSSKCSMIIGAVAEPQKTVILNAKKAGCLIVLTKTNFSSNLLDILKKQI